MATLYNLGRNSGLWNTVLRTDCTAITKKPLKWEARNLDAYPDMHAYLKLGSKVDLSRGWRIEGGFLEGIKNLQATTDFGIFAGVSREF